MVLGVIPAYSQYYYKDVITNKQITAEMQAYRQNKVRTVNIKSFEDDGSDSQGFFCQKKISKDYRKVEVLTKSLQTPPSIFTSWFNENGMVTSTQDSSSIFSSSTQYNYDKEQRLVSVVSISRSDDDDFRNEMKEEHIYVYNNSSLPEKMIRVRNGKDSVTMLFALDDRNNIGIEKDSKNGSKYYYYYDDKSRLTDVVLSNDFKAGLVPAYVFEYNNNGLITQMTISEEGLGNYFIWKYNYENGLRVRERCFSKERKLMGTIEYEYK
jgi:hypothetical protein